LKAAATDRAGHADRGSERCGKFGRGPNNFLFGI
jgi:hypothetical protein